MRSAADARYTSYMKNKARWVNILTVSWLFTFAGCEHAERPTANAAKADFLKQNPSASVIAVVLDQDEVAARSFIIAYVDEGVGTRKESYLVYTHTKRGWESKSVLKAQDKTNVTDR